MAAWGQGAPHRLWAQVSQTGRGGVGHSRHLCGSARAEWSGASRHILALGLQGQCCPPRHTPGTEEPGPPQPVSQ